MNATFEIDQRAYRKNRPLIVFLSLFALLWGIGTTLGACKLAADFSLGQLLAVLCCGLVCLLTLGILFGGNRGELISIEGGNIVSSCSTFPLAKRRMPIAQIQRLILQADMGPVLTILHRNGRDRIPVAPFVGLDGKRRLLNDVCQFLRAHGADCEAVDLTKSAQESEPGTAGYRR